MIFAAGTVVTFASCGSGANPDPCDPPCLAALHTCPHDRSVLVGYAASSCEMGMCH